MSVRRSSLPLTTPFGSGLAGQLLHEELGRVMEVWADAAGRPAERGGHPGAVAASLERACRATDTWLDVLLNVVAPWLTDYGDDELRRRIRRGVRRARRLGGDLDRRRARAVQAELASTRVRTRQLSIRRLERASTLLGLVDETLRHSPPACEGVLLRRLSDRLAADHALELALG